jgi:hypothetical protein
MNFVLATVFNLILLHGPGGIDIYINPREIVTLRDAPKEDEQHISKGVNCIVTTEDGKFSAVLESCEQIRKLLEVKD